jgi:alanine dehydrogenase
MGAHVIIFDVNLDRLRYLDQVLSGRLTTLSANPLNIAQAVPAPTCWWERCSSRGRRRPSW